MGRMQATSTDGIHVISEVGLFNYKHLRRFFDEWAAGRVGGVIFDIESVRKHIGRKPRGRDSGKKSRQRLSHNLRAWANVARKERLFHTKPSGNEAEFYVWPKTGGKHGELWWQIVLSYYDLCSVAAYERTIEQLVLELCEDLHQEHLTKGQQLALVRLLAMNKAFLLAPWFQAMAHKAVANADSGAFAAMAKGLSRDVLKDRALRDKANRWLQVMLLWFLGGCDVRPRKEFMRTLIEMKLVPKGMSDNAFRAMLSNLCLTNR